MPPLTWGLCLKEREVVVADRAPEHLRLLPPQLRFFRRDELGITAAPLVAGVVGVDFGEHPGKSGPRRNDLHAAVLEVDSGHPRMTLLEPPMNAELRLRLAVGVDELIEGVVGADDAAPDVVEGFGTDNRTLFSQAFLLFVIRRTLLFYNKIIYLSKASNIRFEGVAV